jgi:hypothetical protein
MTSTRLKMAQEGLLWKTALAHFGRKGLYEVVVDLWTKFQPPARATVEYLDIDHVGIDVLNILSDAQANMGAVVPNRPADPGRLAIYSVHAEYLAVEVLKIMPVGTLPRSLKGARLEVDLGM